MKLHTVSMSWFRKEFFQESFQFLISFSALPIVTHKHIVSLIIRKYTKVTYYVWKCNIFAHTLMLFLIQNLIHNTLKEPKNVYIINTKKERLFRETIYKYDRDFDLAREKSNVGQKQCNL